MLWNKGNAHFSILTGCNWILYCVCEVALVLRLGLLVCCHFRVARTFKEPRPSAVDMAVPCSKNQPPPEVLFRRGEQSGWIPDPDEFEIPDLSVLEGVVCRQFQKLSAGASSGF